MFGSLATFGVKPIPVGGGGVVGTGGGGVDRVPPPPPHADSAKVIANGSAAESKRQLRVEELLRVVMPDPVFAPANRLPDVVA